MRSKISIPTTFATLFPQFRAGEEGAEKVFEGELVVSKTIVELEPQKSLLVNSYEIVSK